MSKVTMYTDGGCGKDGIGGWGCVLVNEAKGTHLSLSGGATNTTNNVMELTALLQGLKSLISHGITEGVTVISDSEYTKNTFTTWMHGWEKKGWRKADGGEVSNLEIVKQLFEVYPLIKLDDYKWVKGHSGNQYNELCDKLCTNEIKKLRGEPTVDAEAVLSEDPLYLKLNAMTKQEIIKLIMSIPEAKNWLA